MNEINFIFVGVTFSFILCLISYRIGTNKGANALHQQAYKRGYDTAWVDRQIYDAKLKERFRCPKSGRFSEKKI